MGDAHRPSPHGSNAPPSPHGSNAPPSPHGSYPPPSYPGPYFPPDPGAGYSYRPAPYYPPPQFPPPPHRPRRHTPGWAWAMMTVLVVAVVVMGAVTVVEQQRRPWDAPPTTPPTVTQGEDGYGQPNTAPDGEFTGEHLITRLNEALAARDRATFFSYVDGAAVEPLELWWDNMDTLGWTSGAISLQEPQTSTYTEDTITQQVLLGAVTAGSPQIPADSAHPDAGLSYAPANLYHVTIHVTDDGASGVITGWEPQHYTAPWDLEPLYAVIDDHAVVAGYADERELVDRTAGAAEEAAQWVTHTYQQETGTANANRFLTFVTETGDRFNSWFIDGEENTGWIGDRAGTMFPQRRPLPAPGLDPGIATGNRMSTAGGILTIGPNGLQYGVADTTDTLVHEFIHAAHATNVPQGSGSSSVVAEGWATYNESLFQGSGSYAPRLRVTGRTLRSCVAEMDATFPTEQDFVSAEDATCAYALSGSLYAYAASLGVDVYALADEALATGESLWSLIERDGVTFTAEGWSSWLQEQFG